MWKRKPCFSKIKEATLSPGSLKFSCSGIPVHSKIDGVNFLLQICTGLCRVCICFTLSYVSWRQIAKPWACKHFYPVFQSSVCSHSQFCSPPSLAFTSPQNLLAVKNICLSRKVISGICVFFICTCWDSAVGNEVLELLPCEQSMHRWPVAHGPSLLRRPAVQMGGEYCSRPPGTTVPDIWVTAA